ncbi:hypothetical protein Pla108_19100 [Botrimarina colliarenosi]|uniref:PEP-CTERM protein-sorting domain-containing protein n=1 Tax=Botrimarina colliarenosi TaxID=2528001 RepID=A0A5C6AEL2_9BACT|nr:hypothetical protein [Botrimarina colliarenosi]TWT97758.1 hypothetical protein Pla108_19100 [Botrimarina colliarenosi]
MNRYLYPAAATALVAVLAATPPANAQNRWSATAVNNNWNDDDNWDTEFFPDPTFDTSAIVGSTVSGAALSANVTVNGSFTSPTVLIANGAGTSATITIGAGNGLTTVSDPGFTEGDFLIGQGGGLGVVNVAGTLNVARSLETQTGGAFDSTLSLSGSANVAAGYAFFDRQLRVVGPNVSFTTNSDNPATNSSVILGAGGVHTWEFGVAGPSKLNVNGNLDLGGTLAIVTPGYTPTVGAKWTIADSIAIDSQDGTPSGFSFVDVSGVPNLSPGTSFKVRTGATGSIGVLTEVEVIQEPVLTVNRQTGEVTLKNFSSAASTVAFDAYTVRSNLGALAPAALNGLDAKATSGNTWVAANPNVNGIGELNPTTSLSLSASQSIALGNIFAPSAPAAFGEENEDVSFDYGTPDGQLVNVPVVYEGMPNNTLVLNVNPSTGASQLLNPSGFDVGIDSYVISSASGSLSTANWSSFDDQNLEGANQWFEANSGSTQLAELLVEGATAMTANQSVVYGIGSPWLVGGERDLVFQFALAGEETLRTGKVVYGSLVSAVALPGDYNGDNIVDAADYTVWRDANGTSATLPNDPTPGTVGASDYTVWASNYGAALAPANASAVPEPTAVALVAALILGSAARRRG